MARAAGATVDDDRPGRWVVEPGPLAARAVEVEPDLSSAAPFLAAAMATAGTVTVRRWPRVSTQPGALLPALFEQMGGTAVVDGDGLTLTGPGRLSGIDADLHDIGELTPVLAALCALATTPSRLRGVAHLRLHETDRLAALACEIGRLGGDATDTDDGLEIRPSRLRPALLHTYDDHRMVMAAAVLGLAVPGVTVENVATTAKTFPDFPAVWAAAISGATG